MGHTVGCRYQDVYLVRLPELPAAAALTLGSDEVAGVRVLPAEEVLTAWEDTRPGFVPRSAAYTAMMRAALSTVH